VGLNVLQAPGDLPPSLAGAATSLAAELREPPDRRRLLGLLLVELGRVLGEPPVPWEKVRAEVAGRLAWRGRRVRASGECGVLTGLDGEGRLVVEAAPGTRTAIASGTLELAES
jgi:biotin-(acetyl-CoA carboxylase) ligase